MKVELVKPQGYCGGVTNAIKMAYQAKKENLGKKIYVLGALVHNSIVIDLLKKDGIETITDNPFNAIESLNQNDILVFTAHGHDEKLDILAKEKGIKTYDATCPKVIDNAKKIKKELNLGHQVIYIGQKGHKETEAVLSISKNISLYDIQLLINYQEITDKSPLVINQTTLNYMLLKDIHNDILSHIPNARIANEVCVASRQRQEAVFNIENDVDLIVIVGDKSSSNTRKLYDIALAHKNATSYFVHDLNDLIKLKITGYKKAAISSGASTPSFVVEEIYNYLINL